MGADEVLLGDTVQLTEDTARELRAFGARLRRDGVVYQRRH